MAHDEFGITARSAIDRAFVSRPVPERAAIFRGFLRNTFLNRVIYRFHNAVPKLAAVVARAIPIVGAERFAGLLKSDEPVIIAGMHFGPVYFQLLILQRILQKRTMHVLYAERGRDRRSCERFMRAIGCRIILDEPLVARTLTQVMREEPRPTVVFAYDHLPNGRRPIPFLDTSIDVPDGIAYLAERSRATAITFCLERKGLWMRVMLDGPYRVDAALPAAERRIAFVDTLYRMLEAQVRARPEQWTQWPFMSGAAAGKAPGAGDAA